MSPVSCEVLEAFETTVEVVLLSPGLDIEEPWRSHDTRS
jgi:hypothetical protein